MIIIVFLLYIFMNVNISFFDKEVWYSLIWISDINSSVGISIIIININILWFILNFSLDAILLIYINKINNPPTNIRNITIEIQEDNIILDVSMVAIIVCINSITPIDIGVFINNVIEEIISIIFIMVNLISSGILKKYYFWVVKI